MSAATDTAPTQQNQITPAPPQMMIERNPAVIRCCVAYKRGYQAAQAKGRGECVCGIEGAAAYRDAFPPLSGYQNIADFIACVAHALLSGAVTDAVAARLLYAAQVANSVCRVPPPDKQGAREK